MRFKFMQFCLFFRRKVDFIVANKGNKACMMIQSAKLPILKLDSVMKIMFLIPYESRRKVVFKSLWLR